MSSHLKHLLFQTSKSSRNPFIIRKSSFLWKMKPSRSINRSAVRHENVEFCGVKKQLVNKDLKQTNSFGASDMAYDEECASDMAYDEEYPPLSSLKVKRRSRNDLGTQHEQKSAKEARDAGSLQHAESSTSQQDDSSLPTSFGKKYVPRDNRRPKYLRGEGSSDRAERQPVIDPFDICLPNSSKSSVQMLHENNMEQDSEMESPIIERIDLGTQHEKKSAKEARDAGSLQHVESSTSQQDDNSLPTSFGKKYVPRDNRRPKYLRGEGSSDRAERQPVIDPFDICLPNSSKSSVQMLHENNMEQDSEMESPIIETRQLLRPGMILLTNYISLGEQVEIVNKCRELGVGPGGFYQPGYQDGAKLRLRMMCLGKKWDPETKYEEQIRSDDSEPPGIPAEFVLLVERALLDSHALIKKHGGMSNAEEILPRMFPDICIVNFYTTNGKLGLHQDRDESRESLDRGLPVVSFSVGDSAEFLYGDQRHVNKAERIMLHSGDVLIFGGKSRHIFHGVTSIIPNSAPPALLKEAKLRPGRLNLTFRQF